MASRKKPASQKTDARGAVIAAALEVAATGDWPAATLQSLAEAAALPSGEVHALFTSPADIVAAILNEGVAAAMGEAAPDASLSPKDRVFDAAMNVFDALKSRRAPLGAMLASYRMKPLSGAAVWGAMARFARVSLERAGIGAGGIAGGARVAALGRSLALVLAVFAEDDDGLSRTMAALDTRLREAERWAKRLGWASAEAPR